MRLARKESAESMLQKVCSPSGRRWVKRWVSEGCPIPEYGDSRSLAQLADWIDMVGAQSGIPVSDGVRELRRLSLQAYLAEMPDILKRSAQKLHCEGHTVSLTLILPANEAPDE